MIQCLRRGGVGVLRTDTLYGIVARADDETAVRRIFEIKQRDQDKPLIVLLPSADLAPDGAAVIQGLSDSGAPTTVIVDSLQASGWLKHSDGSVGYRVVRRPSWLLEILQQTGPLVAPSANPQGKPPARTVTEAKSYFGDSVDYYLDGGKVSLDQKPSRVFKVLPDGSKIQLR